MGCPCLDFALPSNSPVFRQDSVPLQCGLRRLMHPAETSNILFVCATLPAFDGYRNRSV